MSAQFTEFEECRVSKIINKVAARRKADVSRAQKKAKADSLVCVPLSPPQDIVWS